MSDKHNADETVEEENTPPISRRKFVKAGSAATLGITGLGVGSAAASSPNTEPNIDIQQVTGSETTRPISVARRSPEYHLLKDYIKENKGEVVDSTNAKVLETTDGNDDPYTVVSFDSQEGQEGQADETTDVNIAIALRNEKIQTARGTRTIFGSNGEPGTIQSFEIQNGEVIEKSGKVEKIRNQHSDAVTPQISACRYCKEVKRAACVVGCGVGTAAICLALSLAPPAAIACAGVASSVCYAISELGGCKVSARMACSYGGLNYC